MSILKQLYLELKAKAKAKEPTIREDFAEGFRQRAAARKLLFQAEEKPAQEINEEIKQEENNEQS